jgi:hypothetical protein
MAAVAAVAAMAAMAAVAAMAAMAAMADVTNTFYVLLAFLDELLTDPTPQLAKL